MKRSREILLAAIYLLLLVFTLVMECIGIGEPALRVLVNLGTLGMAAVGMALLCFVYRSGNREKGAEQEQKEESGEAVFDKEAYLAFAAEHGFTRRETEVGLLVANGCSNLRIAEELFISETTVKKHVTHIYEKSGISGRRDFSGRFFHSTGTRCRLP
ncbi:MAG: helix-turn-helix transcriptional regulator [Muribaculaceae bacterium]|nr:helix-turn-helix transcriptional regulator [Roseburia sp.]MCM1431271.1 helix-turn-helix transcriptional regulator [Muribaculaceae bacterium]MCM1492243.1 helix-turn-helix transcriptional regulator [Muribaculaceae bacterium]